MSGTPATARKNGKLGGRPRGQLAIINRERANELAKKNGTLPLDVMIENMLFWWDKAKFYEEKLNTLVVTETDEKSRAEARKLVQNFLEAREKSQVCAVEAAPYFHAKLHSVASNVPLTPAEAKAITSTTPPDEAMKEYLRIVGRG